MKKSALISLIFLIIYGCSNRNVKTKKDRFNKIETISKTPIDSTDTDFIKVEICVNRLGIVQSAQIIETTTTSERLKELAIENAKKHKFSISLLAPEIQCGTLTYDFKVK